MARSVEDSLESISAELSRISKFHDEIGRNLAKSLHPANFETKKLVYEEFPVEIDWEYPHIRGRASIVKTGSDVKIEVVISPQDVERFLELAREGFLDTLSVSNFKTRLV